jgi:hypothetical protein
MRKRRKKIGSRENVEKSWSAEELRMTAWQWGRLSIAY